MHCQKIFCSHVFTVLQCVCYSFAFLFRKDTFKINNEDDDEEEDENDAAAADDDDKKIHGAE